MNRERDKHNLESVVEGDINLTPARSEWLQNEVSEEYAQIRLKRSDGQRVKYLTISESRTKKYQINWNNYFPPEPVNKNAIILNNYPLEELVPYIDWTPFFTTWIQTLS